MTEESFKEVSLECPDCGHGFPIMVQSDGGSTITICEGCMEHLRVEIKEGEVTGIGMKG